MNANPILLQKKYARIVELFASKKKISIDKALGIFYHSVVYQLMRDGISDMHCMSDSYLEKELEKEMKDFSNQKIKEYAKPNKTLKDCKETLELLKEEKERSNPYILLGRVFELYKQGAKEEHADWYFFKYLESLKIEDHYTFSVGETEITVPVDVFTPFVEIETEGRVINPQWHLMIAYYAYIDAMYNHNDNEYAKKIKTMPGHPTGKFGIRCKSLKKWMEEAFGKHQKGKQNGEKSGF